MEGEAQRRIQQLQAEYEQRLDLERYVHIDLYTE